MRPTVGITCGYSENERMYYLRPGYWEAVERAGGTPLVLPPANDQQVVDHYLEVCDGFILSGGDDIDPAYWGEDPQPGLGEIDPQRDQFESRLVGGIITRDKAALFICRGIQVLNVVLGGNLLQDLNSGMSHRQKAPRHHPFHDILVEKTSRLYLIMQSPTLRVNSFHHQAIRQVAPGLVVSARSRDGVVEAVEYPTKRWIVGVQWHPEAMRDDGSARLFRSLVEAAMGRQ